MFFSLIDIPQIKSATYDYIFSLCDKISFLHSCNPDSVDIKTAIVTTPYEKIFRDIDHQENGESWGMTGKIIYLKPTAEIVNLIKSLNLEAVLHCNENTRIENLTLYKNKKVLYSVCSHEGYTEIDEEFSKKIVGFCLKEIEHVKEYQEIVLNVVPLANKSLSSVAKELFILNDLQAYIQQAWQDMVYVPPKEDISFNKHLTYAKKYLTQNTFYELNNHHSFKSIHADTQPSILPDSFLVRSKKPINENKLCNKILNEISMNRIAIFKNLGKDIFKEF